MKIEKYELKIVEKQTIDVGGNLPTVLKVKEQGGKLMMWVQFDEDYPGSFNLDIDIAETGKSYQTQGTYADSVIMASGNEYHVFTKSNYIRTAE